MLDINKLVMDFSRTTEKLVEYVNRHIRLLKTGLIFSMMLGFAALVTALLALARTLP